MKRVEIYPLTNLQRKELAEKHGLDKTFDKSKMDNDSGFDPYKNDDDEENLGFSEF